MKKSATQGFTKSGKPGLTWPVSSYAPAIWILIQSFMYNYEMLFSTQSYTLTHAVRKYLVERLLNFTLHILLVSITC